MPRKLDIDIGTDDAVAIMPAAVHPEPEPLGVAMVNGYAGVQHCTDSTLRKLDFIGPADERLQGGRSGRDRGGGR